MTRTEREALLARLRTDAQCIADRFGLNYREIVAERANVKSRYGICYADGLIKIRLAHAKTGSPLRYSSLIDTVCHELAHLKHFNHGPQFKQFFWQLLGWARDHGIYRPAKRSAPGASANRTPREPATADLSLPLRNGTPVFGSPATSPAAMPAHWPNPHPDPPRPKSRQAPRTKKSVGDSASAPVQLRLF